MQTTIDNGQASSAVTQAKAEFIRAKERLVHGLATTPDDKVNWSPAPTARTPVQLVAHAALSIAGMQGWFAGTPFRWASMAEADAEWRQEEKAFTSPQQALDLLEKNSAAYLAWLDSLTPELLASTLHTAMGDFPLAYAITFTADHLRGHAAQLDYLQTVWGDLDWHMG